VPNEYEDVTVEYSPGETPRMEVGEEIIALASYKTEEDLHALMQSKGLVRKSEAAVQAAERVDRELQSTLNYNQVGTVYTLCGAALLLIFCLRMPGRKR